MNENKKRSRLPLLILLLILLLLTLLGVAVGKYVTTLKNPGNVTFTANLAASVTLQEHKAVRQTDGTYTLDKTAEPVTSNTYILIPGVDIPKDPYITITGRTSIPAILFIEIESSLDEGTQLYSVDANWSYLTTSVSKKVYYYNADPSGTISILQGNQITISQKLLLEGDEGSDALTINALLKEKVGNNDPLTTYNQ